MVGVCTVVLVHNILQIFPVYRLLLPPIDIIANTVLGLITGDRVNECSPLMTFSASSSSLRTGKMADIIVTAFILSKFREEDNVNRKAFKYINVDHRNCFILIVPENGSTAAVVRSSL